MKSVTPRPPSFRVNELIMHIVWYKRLTIQKPLYMLRRLFDASIREIAFRLRNPVKNRFLRHRFNISNPSPRKFDLLSRLNLDMSQLEKLAIHSHKGHIDEVKAEVAKYYTNRQEPAFFFDPDEAVSIINELEPAAKCRILEDANQVLEHNFQLFNLKFAFESHIDWHMDPTTSKQWPKMFLGGITYNSNKYTKDVKYIWELNRHKHFVTLGKAYLLVGDERYAKEFCNQIHQWKHDNPPEIGINWVDNLEVAMRSIAWLWAYHFFKNSPSLDDSTLYAMLESIHQHAQHLSSELSIYTSANNHLIGEATALWMIGVLFPEFKESRKWTDVAFNILQTEMERQFHPDGVHAEQGIGYHRFVLDFYIQVIVLAQKNSAKIPGEMMRKVEKMFEFILALVDCNGRVPMLGDSDDARGLPVANGEFWDFRDSLSTGAVLFVRSDMKEAAGDFHETSLWLLGLDGKKKFDILAEDGGASKSKAFSHGGYYVMGSGHGTEEMKSVLDCGPLGLPPRFGHGHADILSFTLSAFGTEMIVDPGTFGYMCAGDKKSYFRGTRAHNTVVVDGLDQADPWGASRWLNIPKPTIHNWITTRNYDFIDASHDGYERLRASVTHRRMVFYVRSKYWIILDFLLGQGHHQYDQYFHFPPGTVLLDPLTKIAILRFENGRQLAVMPATPSAISASLVKGSSSPFEGWISYSYGDKKPSPVVTYTKNSEAPTSFQTIIRPFRGDRQPHLTIRPVDLSENEHQNQKVGLRIESNSLTDYFIASCDGAAAKSWEEYQSDADIIYVRKGPGSRHKVFLVNGSFLSIGSNKFFTSDSRSDFEELEVIDGSTRLSADHTENIHTIS